jgi:hypothetical protein
MALCIALRVISDLTALKYPLKHPSDRPHNMVQSTQKSVTTSFRLSPEQFEFIEQQAAAAGVSRSEYILLCVLNPPSLLLGTAPPTPPTIPQVNLEIQEVAKATLCEFRALRNFLEYLPAEYPALAIVEQLQQLLIVQSARISSLQSSL